MTWRPRRGALRHARLALAIALLAVPAGAQPPEALPRVESGDRVYGSASLRSATCDPATRRVYLTTAYGDTPRVHVYQVRTALGSPAS